jgi:hypothetical protein
MAIESDSPKAASPTLDPYGKRRLADVTATSQASHVISKYQLAPARRFSIFS